MTKAAEFEDSASPSASAATSGPAIYGFLFAVHLVIGFALLVISSDHRKRAPGTR